MFSFLFVETPFKAFETSHKTSMILIVALSAILIFLNRRARKPSSVTKINRFFALFLLAGTIFFQIYKVAQSEFYKGWILPFQMCDLAMYAGIVALWWNHRLAKTILFYWGLTLSTQGVLTPDTWFDFPHIDFFRYWFLHVGVVVAAIYVTIGMRFLPTWNDYRNIVLFTLGWCGFVFVFNYLFQANYIYLMQKPEADSVLNLFPVWPYYIFLTFGIAFTIWALITYPFNRKRRLFHK